MSFSFLELDAEEAGLACARTPTVPAAITGAGEGELSNSDEVRRPITGGAPAPAATTAGFQDGGCGDIVTWLWLLGSIGRS